MLRYKNFIGIIVLVLANGIKYNFHKVMIPY